MFGVLATRPRATDGLAGLCVATLGAGCSAPQCTAKPPGATLQSPETVAPSLGPCGSLGATPSVRAPQSHSDGQPRLSGHLGVSHRHVDAQAGPAGAGTSGARDHEATKTWASDPERQDTAASRTAAPARAWRKGRRRRKGRKRRAGAVSPRPPPLKADRLVGRELKTRCSCSRLADLSPATEQP